MVTDKISFKKRQNQQLYLETQKKRSESKKKEKEVEEEADTKKFLDFFARRILTKGGSAIQVEGSKK